VILDLMLPGIDGLEVCRVLKMREKTSSIPIIMLTAKGTETDIVVGLELGADDYIVKPFSPRELIARVKAVLRRAQPKKKTKLFKVGDLVMDLTKYTEIKQLERVKADSFLIEQLFINLIDNAVKHIVLLHNGEISVDSKVGRGTTFTIILPG